MNMIRRTVLRLSTAAALTAMFATVGAVQTASAANQPNMQEALRLLNQAEAKLRAASHNKGGHRAKALKLIEEAKREVHLGIQYANQHQKKK